MKEKSFWDFYSDFADILGTPQISAKNLSNLKSIIYDDYEKALKRKNDFPEEHRKLLTKVALDCGCASSKWDDVYDFIHNMGGVCTSQKAA